MISQIKRSDFGLYTLMLVGIYDSWIAIKPASRKDRVPIKNIYLKLGRQFSIKKSRMKEYLRMFQETQCISITKTGIKLNYEVIDE